jgi:hypothetical protein
MAPRTTPDHAGSGKTEVPFELDQRISALRALGMRPLRAKELAVQGATPQSLQDAAKIKLHKMWMDVEQLEEFKRQKGEAGAFDLSVEDHHIRNSLRIYHRYLSNFNKNDQKFLDSKSVIFGTTDVRKRGKANKKAQVSTLTARDFKSLHFPALPKPMASSEIQLLDPLTTTIDQMDRSASTYSEAAAWLPRAFEPELVFLEETPLQTIQLFVALPSRGTEVMMVSPLDQIRNVLLRIEHRFNLRGNDISLFKGNKKIYNSTVQLNGLKNDDTLQIFVPLKGGMERTPEPLVLEKDKKYDNFDLEAFAAFNEGVDPEEAINFNGHDIPKFSHEQLPEDRRQRQTTVEPTNRISARVCFVPVSPNDKSSTSHPQSNADNGSTRRVSELPKSGKPKRKNLIPAKDVYTKPKKGKAVLKDTPMCYKCKQNHFPFCKTNSDAPLQKCFVCGEVRMHKNHPKGRWCNPKPKLVMDQQISLTAINSAASQVSATDLADAVDVRISMPVLDEIDPDELSDSDETESSSSEEDYDIRNVDNITDFELKTKRNMYAANEQDIWHSLEVAALFRFYHTNRTMLYIAILFLVFWISSFAFTAVSFYKGEFLELLLGLLAKYIIGTSIQLFVAPYVLSKHFYLKYRDKLLANRKAPGYNPDDYILVDGKLICRNLNIRHAGAQYAVPVGRGDYDLLNDPKVAAALAMCLPDAKLGWTCKQLNLDAVYVWFWEYLVDDLPNISQKTEYIRFTKVTSRPPSDGPDGRASIVGMTKILNNDPVVVNFRMTVGNFGYDKSVGLNVSMALVAQIISSPNLHSDDVLISDIDKLINFNIKGMHGVNIAMHDNLTPNVIADTIQFIKYYIRHKRQMRKPLLRLGEVE